MKTFTCQRCGVRHRVGAAPSRSEKLVCEASRNCRLPFWAYKEEGVTVVGITLETVDDRGLRTKELT